MATSRKPIRATTRANRLVDPPAFTTVPSAPHLTLQCSWCGLVIRGPRRGQRLANLIDGAQLTVCLPCHEHRAAVWRGERVNDPFTLL